jgi:hypothetical protein
MDVFKNEWLQVRRGVRTTPIIEPVILALDAYFKEANLKATVTSGERTSGDQLTIIRNYAKSFKVDQEFKEILTCGVLDKIDFGSEKIFTWQRAWSRLLNIGVIVNPPVQAKVLFDYVRDGVNKKGQIINQSPHYYGKAFDIGGGVDHDPTNELEVLKKAMGKVRGLKGYLLERKQNCLHVDCI